ncbi:MAG: UDP-glucose 4-epimerase GalE [Bacteroidales bacterium]|jgi:UDP-glucose 4-epimerase|nr:UDP-glucose 4-epimerase GalE [Bacteroidales bacterium]NLK81422.1 UDP-glucose 4-epimerase GalE [Bacteroidales bacterium]HPY82202.1 UDP-glucose 4-epimerase GalE [Bacteroidales bacterium]
MAKVLVTGGLGYIGSHTVVELLAQNHEVIIVDNLSNSEYCILSKISEITHTTPAFEQIDICDTDALRACFKAHGPIHAVIHFAAYKAVGESVSNSLLYYKNNVLGLLSVLECMREFSVCNIVFSSSCTVYGQPTQLPVTEQAPIQKALSPYGNTKQICEEIICDAIHSYNDICAVILRYFNPIGAHPSACIGELPKGVPNNLVPFITQTAAGVRKQLQVFGNDYNTPDGSAIRDYIYVVDLAKAHVKALDKLCAQTTHSGYELFNLGTGTGISVLEMVHTFERVTGVSVPYTIASRREGDIEQVWADTTRANRELDWFANTSLEDILLSAWNWEKKIRNL